MGLRKASRRHLYASVMAPALTEANSSQNFKLTGNTLPVNGKTNHGGCSPLVEDHLMCKDERSIVTKSHADNNGLENLNTLALASEIVKSADPGNVSGTMNEQDTMGLQNTEAPILIKDKSNANDVDSLFHSLQHTADLAETDINQELIQALTSIENASSQQNEENAIPSSVPGPDINLTNFYKDLFKYCDVFSQVDENAISTESELLDLEKVQKKLERRHDFLLRRLYKIQVRGMSAHVSSEVAGLFEHEYRAMVEQDERNIRENAGEINHVLSEDEKKIKDQKPKGVPASVIKSFVHKLEKSKAFLSSACHRNTKVNLRYFGSGTLESTSQGSSKSVLVPSLDEEPRRELEKVAGSMQAELEMVRRQVDSDVTESSSGAESCDEMQNFNNPHQQYCTISKRASWRWLQDRAAVATRWTWLQWQISDLEYRIRQLNELQKQIRNTKGAVVLKDTAPGSNSGSPCSVNGYRSPVETWVNGTAVKTPSGKTPSSSMPGTTSDVKTSGSCSRTRQFMSNMFRKRRLLATTDLHITSKKCRPATMRCGCVTGTPPCALCTGRADPTYPKEPGDLTTVYEQIAYLDPGFHHKISFPENVSHIFHFNTIIKTPEWQQKTIRSMNKALKIPVKSVEKKEEKSERILNKRSDQRRKYNKLMIRNSFAPSIKNKFVKVRKANRRTAASLLGKLNRGGKQHQHAEVAMAQLQALSADDLDASGDMTAPPSIAGSVRPSPAPSPQPPRRSRCDSYDIDNIVIPYSVASSTRVEKLPYKEILTPKWRLLEPESDSKNNGLSRGANSDSDVEDVNDEAVLVRHEKCEVEERRKFMSYIKFPLTGSRSRASRRTDSRTESSGANTPDPMSPHATGESIMQQDSSNLPAIASPPSSESKTPNVDKAASCSLALGSKVSQASILGSKTSQVSEEGYLSLRRRTASQSRWVREREPPKEDFQYPLFDQVEAAPYESRTFPLEDEVYDKMLRIMPAGHPVIPGCSEYSSKSGDLSDFVRPGSPDSDSTNESVTGEEDPNDPEWMALERNRDRAKR